MYMHEDLSLFWIHLGNHHESPKKNRKSNDVLQVMKLCNVVSYCMYSTLYAVCTYLVHWTIATSCAINHAELQSSHFALAFADDAER